MFQSLTAIEKVTTRILRTTKSFWYRLDLLQICDYKSSVRWGNARKFRHLKTKSFNSKKTQEKTKSGWCIHIVWSQQTGRWILNQLQTTNQRLVFHLDELVIWFLINLLVIINFTFTEQLLNQVIETFLSLVLMLLPQEKRRDDSLNNTLLEDMQHLTANLETAKLPQ